MIRKKTKHKENKNTKINSKINSKANEKLKKTLSKITISHPDKIIAGSKNVTKIELIEYYQKISDRLLPHIIERPIMILRCPGKLPKNCFYQKHTMPGTSKYIHQIEITEKNSKGYYLMIKDELGLISLIQSGAVELHPWGSRINNIEKPDIITFDLDPDPNVPWSKVTEAAKLIQQKLAHLDLQSFIKLSGGKGLHIVIPIVPVLEWSEIKEFTRAFAQYIVQLSPFDFIATASKDKRGNKIFIDYLRNDRGSTSVAVYSTRAKINIPISTPIRWNELSKIKSAQEFNIKNIQNRLSKQKKDPWEDFFKVKQRLSKQLIKAFLKSK